MLLGNEMAGGGGEDIACVAVGLSAGSHSAELHEYVRAAQPFLGHPTCPPLASYLTRKASMIRMRAGTTPYYPGGVGGGQRRPG